MLLTLGTDPGDFHHRMVDGEAEAIGLCQQAGIAMLDLGDLFAVTTNQELCGTLMAGMHAADKGIATFDAVYQSLSQQKLERAIDDWRSDALSTASLVQ
jgi:hypothetical protein